MTGTDPATRPQGWPETRDREVSIEGPIMNRNLGLLVATAITISFARGASDAADGLVGYWKLTADARDSSGAERHAVNHGVRFDDDGGAVFNGVDA